MISEKVLKDSFQIAYSLLEDVVIHKRYEENDIDRLLNLIYSTTLDVEAIERLSSYFNQLKATDSLTYVHSIKVSWYCVNLAKWSDLSLKHCRDSLIMGMFHDIGKVGMPVSMLNKPGRLNDREWNLMKRHPEYGSLWLYATGQLPDFMIDVISEHHEKPNGCGYPAGKKDLSIQTKILTVCDIFDALTSERSYKSAMPLGAAMDVMGAMQHSGELDNKVFKTLSENISKLGESNIVTAQ